MRRVILSLFSIAVVAASVLSCGSSSPAAVAGHEAGPGNLTFAVSDAFTGPQAFSGQVSGPPAKMACTMINEAGGILGHNCQVDYIDTHSDTADALVALRQEMVTANNLTGVIGVGTTDAPTLLPILDKARLPTLSFSGSSDYIKSSYRYLWLLQPPDAQQGAAMAAEAIARGLKHAALLFTNSPDSLSVRDGAMQAYQRLGGTVAVEELIAPDQASYGTEIERVVGSNPDAILTELDPKTAGTFFGSLKNLHGINLPIISDAVAVQPDWYTAVKNSIGPNLVATWATGLSSANPTTPGTDVFNKRLHAAFPDLGAPDTYSWSVYDGVNLAALAMIDTKSTNPAKFNDDILKLATPSTGAVTVFDFASGKAALDQGKRIYYQGANGGMYWNRYHSVDAPAAVTAFGVDGSQSTSSTISVEEIAKAMGV
jgi:ABC-type branched-subunit amino acid transport system substrate-binding protein